MVSGDGDFCDRPARKYVEMKNVTVIHFRAHAQTQMMQVRLVQKRKFWNPLAQLNSNLKTQ